MTGRSR